jgi:hypothetical protein
MSNHPLTLAVRFGLELAMLGVYGAWGWRAANRPLAFVLAIGLPLLAAVLWGAFVSPKAAVVTPGIVRLAVEAALFGGATWMLLTLGAPSLAASFAGLALLQAIAAYDRIALLLRS